MTTTIRSIRYTISQGDLLSMDGVTVADVLAYETALTTALKAAYPDADVDVTVDPASGATARPWIVTIDEDGDECPSRDEERDVEDVARGVLSRLLGC